MRTKCIVVVAMLCLIGMAFGCATIDMNSVQVLNSVTDSCEAQYKMTYRLYKQDSISEQEFNKVENVYEVYRNSLLVYKQQKALKDAGQNIDLTQSIFQLNNAIIEFLDLIGALAEE